PHRLARDETIISSIRVEKEGPFLDRPPKIAALGDNVDFFDVILPDIGQINCSVRSIKAKTVRIPQSVRIDLLDRPGLANKRIILGDPFLSVRRGARFHIISSDFAKYPAFFWGISAGKMARALVIRGPAITNCKKKKSILAEAQSPAVVIC